MKRGHVIRKYGPHYKDLLHVRGIIKHLVGIGHLAMKRSHVIRKYAPHKDLLHVRGIIKHLVGVGHLAMKRGHVIRKYAPHYKDLLHVCVYGQRDY